MKTPEETKMRSLRRNALSWEREHGRQFFWRRYDPEPFSILVVEVLLARTRSEAVEPVAKSLLGVYPRPLDMAGADVREVERILFPLGLYRKRARSLLKLASVLVEEYDGEVPRNYESLVTLPYVGRYAANAVMSVAFGARRPVVDSNVARLFGRYFGIAPATGKLESAEEYWEMAREALPASHVRLYNWALLDLGALVCTPRSPRCVDCPLKRHCHYYARGTRGS